PGLRRRIGEREHGMLARSAETNPQRRLAGERSRTPGASGLRIALAGRGPAAGRPDLSLRVLAARPDDPPRDGKWSARATLAFVLGSCGAFWCLAFYLAALALRR
ncbi:MAG: hypothetical protein ACRDQZ_02905, partial [Mycobacteriales bacterium]